MILEIEGTVPEKTSVTISLCGQTKTIDTLDKKATFTVPEPGNIELCMQGKASENNHTFIQILLYLLTASIQGLFNILLMNVDSAWYKNVNAYKIKARCMIEVRHDTCIRFNLSETKYIGYNSIWENPILMIGSNISPEVTFEKDLQSISNEYFSYVKRVTSVAMVLWLIFMVLLIVAVTHHKITAAILLAVLILSELVLVVGVIKKEYRRYRSLSNAFLQRTKE